MIKEMDKVHILILMEINTKVDIKMVNLMVKALILLPTGINM